jgi:hypothetical protein
LVQDRTNKTECAGAILEPSSILVKADCATRDTLGRVAVGVSDPADLSSAQFSMIDSIIVHPSFKAGDIANNLAILRLKTPLNLGPGVATVLLPGPANTTAPSTELLGFALTGWKIYSLLSIDPATTAYPDIGPGGFVSAEAIGSETDFESGLNTVIFNSSGETLLGFGLGTGTVGAPQEANVTVYPLVSWIESNLAGN